MYNYFTGKLVDKAHNQKGYFLTLEVNGIGYLFEVTERDYLSAGELNEDLKVYSVLIHKEDTMFLCGFLLKQTRDLFQILTSVSGVGTKMGMALLGQFEFGTLVSIVINGNYKELTLAKGVGQKLAQKIILELKDKLIKTDITPSCDKEITETEDIRDAKCILQSLGYELDEIQKAMNFVIPTLEENSTSEELLRATLTKLSM